MIEIVKTFSFKNAMKIKRFRPSDVRVCDVLMWQHAEK